MCHLKKINFWKKHLSHEYLGITLDENFRNDFQKPIKYLIYVRNNLKIFDITPKEALNPTFIKTFVRKITS